MYINKLYVYIILLLCFGKMKLDNFVCIFMMVFVLIVFNINEILRYEMRLRLMIYHVSFYTSQAYPNRG